MPDLDLQTIIAGILAALGGGLVLKPNLLLSLFQKKSVVIGSSKEEATQAVQVLITYCIANDDSHVESLVALARTLYVEQPNNAV